MHVDWLTNKELIEATITDPSVYPFVNDDSCGPSCEFVWPEDDKFFAVGCFDDGYMGCFCFHENSDSEVEIHTCLLPFARGKSRQFGDLVVRFILQNRSYLVISTYVPKMNTLAKRLALKCGFELDGKGPLFNGEETDRLVFVRA
jgi:RimJ/RimL family protein N-acetyltransferase